ncbi:MAG TPA: dTDP-4-dehydrorhamnose 3,5-epimerase [Rhizomicrobium sp.]|jgi:dTDP-4-dehydrorhamnose 3,5-epimerase|nr:dTDP-4-dehydrorhamnose 3,5-epimerase [Rhizomicrobium sp.]
MNLPRIEKTELEGVLSIVPARFGDTRGYFSESYNRSAFREIGVTSEFVQDNQSQSRDRATVRGLHFQIPPFAQAKLVRVLRGAICDVAVDIRRASPGYGRSVAVVLSAQNGRQLFVPAGFAHGFCTLETDTEVFYKVDAPHSRDHERGLRWNDPALAISWPIGPSQAILLERDRLLPLLADLPEYF